MGGCPASKDRVDLTGAELSTDVEFGCESGFMPWFYGSRRSSSCVVLIHGVLEMRTAKLTESEIEPFTYY